VLVDLRSNLGEPLRLPIEIALYVEPVLGPNRLELAEREVAQLLL
jgi:hypothetical protein